MTLSNLFEVIFTITNLIYIFVRLPLESWLLYTDWPSLCSPIKPTISVNHYYFNRRNKKIMKLINFEFLSYNRKHKIFSYTQFEGGNRLRSKVKICPEYQI